MKVDIDPRFFRQMLNNVLIYHGDVELDSNIGVFTPTQVEFKDVSLEILSIYAIYNEDFFLDYYATEERVPLSQSLLEQMRRGFSKGKIMKVYTENDKIHLDCETEHYEETLIGVAPVDFPIPFREDDMLGLVPTNLNAIVQLEVEAKELANLPKAKEYLFRCDGRKLEVVVEDVGRYTKKIVPNIERSMDELEVTFEASYFAKAANQFIGDGISSNEVWLSLNEDVAVFSQRNPSHTLTYMLGSQ